MKHNGTRKNYSDAAIPLFVFVVIAFGGAAQFFLISDLGSRLASIGLIGALLIKIEQISVSRVVLIFFLIAIFGAAAQLLPIPYNAWQMLPGTAEASRLLSASDSVSSYRQVSISPSRTLDSLLFLIVPISGYLLGRNSGKYFQIIIVNTIIVSALCSAILGLVQIIGPHSLDVYPYAITNEGSAVGIFANRNHQSIFMVLALAFVALRLCIVPRSQIGDLFSLAATILFAVAALMTQSRAGSGLAAMALIFLYFAIYSGYFGAIKYQNKAPIERFTRFGIALAGICILVFSAMPVALRISDLSGQAFNRTEGLAISIAAIRDFWLTGSGLGSFEWLASNYEDPENLSFAHWNHAHSDWLQLLLELGLVGAILIVIVLFFIVSRITTSIRSFDHKGAEFQFLSVSLFGICVVLIHSAVDYPLRTSAISFLVFWLAGSVDGTLSQRVRVVNSQAA